MDPADSRASDDSPPAAETAVRGARWALGLGGALLLALALLTAARWFGRSAVSTEEIAQIPVPLAAPTPTPRPEVLAPDPGDTP